VALTRRELGAFFVSPVAYIILTVLLFITGLFFAGVVTGAAEKQLPLDYSGTLSVILWIVITTSALVTMRLIAEEKKQGTLEIVMTAPISETQFVLAKFTAAVLLLAYLILPTVAYVVIVSQYGTVDWGAVACGYAGVLLVGAAAYANGLFISSLCTNQITAGIITFAISFLLLVATVLSAILPPEAAWRRVVEYIDLSASYSDFVRGVVDVRRLAYLASVTVFFLFLTTRVVESRRWR
jgi:ABC-2 type transport system permease protein